MFGRNFQTHLNTPVLTVLLQNREFDVPSALALEAKEYLLANFSVDYESYDVILGYRADDSYFSFAQDFINGTISYRQLNNAMYLGKLGMQFVLKSKKAFDRIKFVGSEIAESSEWYTKKCCVTRLPAANISAWSEIAVREAIYISHKL